MVTARPRQAQHSSGWCADVRDETAAQRPLVELRASHHESVGRKSEHGAAVRLGIGIETDEPVQICGVQIARDALNGATFRYGAAAAGQIKRFNALQTKAR